MSDIFVYLGPTLALSTAQSYLSATYLPPIKRGDLATLPDETQIVGIVDGVFHQSLAVSPKEIIALLDRGVRVYGASSIGALRAAEMHMYGMIGVGEIFEMYRDRVIDADDEVAVAYDPLADRTVSEPLVNIRSALRLAVAQRIVSSKEAGEIISTMKGTYYPLRSYQLLGHMYPALAPFLKAGRYDQKRDDAVLLLRTIAGHAAVLPDSASYPGEPH
ncbi:MAG: TfuA-like protein [Terracidiphilus sp.]